VPKRQDLDGLVICTKAIVEVVADEAEKNASNPGELDVGCPHPNERLGRDEIEGLG
jgi:hypothetical protein